MTTQFLTETVTTPVNYNCDVLVCGGGTAGVTAALAAARNGAKTMLVEHGGYVGGTLVNGAGPLHSFFNLYNAYPEAGKHQVVRGIAQEIVEKLQARGESTGHMEQKCGGNYDSVITLIDWEGYKALALEMLQEAGVQLLLHTDVVSVCKEDDRVHYVVVQNKSGREAICAKVVIDTTGDADVAALSGCEVEKRHQTTSVGMPFSMQHVDMKRLIAYLEEKQLITQLVSGSKLSEGNQANRIGFDLKKVPEFTQFMEENGIWGRSAIRCTTANSPISTAHASKMSMRRMHRCFRMLKSSSVCRSSSFLTCSFAIFPALNMLISAGHRKKWAFG